MLKSLVNRPREGSAYSTKSNQNIKAKVEHTQEASVLFGVENFRVWVYGHTQVGLVNFCNIQKGL